MQRRVRFSMTSRRAERLPLAGTSLEKRLPKPGSKMKAPVFASVGKPTGTIDVRLSYRIIELFSEGLYQSPNKAIEELVANSFDAGAQRVLVLLSSNLQDQAATITIIDDG